MGVQSFSHWTTREVPRPAIESPDLSILCSILPSVQFSSLQSLSHVRLPRAHQFRLGSLALDPSPKLHFPHLYGRRINLGQPQSGSFYNLCGCGSESRSFGGVPKNPPLPFFFFSFLSMEDKVPSLHLDSKTFPGLAGPLNSKASCITEFPGLARNRYSINVCSIYGLEAFLETI